MIKSNFGPETEMANTKKKREEMAFEEAMGQLEAIVDGMESDKLPLEKLVTSYEKGTRLLKICQDRIADAQKRIELIAKEAGTDEFQLSAFDAAGGVEEEERPAAEERVLKEEESDEVRLL